MDIAKRVIEFVMDILQTVAFVGSLFIVVYLFIMQPNQVQGHSMDVTFFTQEYILTNKLAYRFSEPRRGDVIVFHAPDQSEEDYIKRIIGVPGDTIKIQGETVYLNGKVLDEPYVQHPTAINEDGYVQEGVEIKVPERSLFVMGDNRPKSQDSRYFGPIPYQSVIGRVFFRYFPANRIGTIKNPIQSSASLYLQKKVAVSMN